MSEVFTIPLRVYYEDTDAGGVVYHANYLRFIERCRSEWLISAGWPLDRVENTFGATFVVTAIDAQFHAPARLMDMLTVSCEMIETRRVQFKAKQTVCRGNEPLFTALVSLACLNRATFKPLALPAPLLPLFRN